MVFNQARENKKNHITDFSEVKRLNVGNDQRVSSNTTNHRHGRGRGSPQGLGINHPDDDHQDPPFMMRPYKMSVPQFGGWDNKSKGATNYSLLFFQARENKKNLKTYLTRRDSIRNDQMFAIKSAKKHHRHGGHGPYTRFSQHDRGHSDPPERSKNVLSYMNWCSCKPVRP
ncbi:hypothetical protein TSUD_152320 [Trifolium subterraneum]|uniref:RIN4 pathogenic type III effector avirulence factor Avr cleavage site domain-containing protein n=1 Tax=Trifolium subterraneum TaxID=3900 RepID=A0A2Z6NA02_TRISU|nr:hypothetical protein TSUD_152320 [Trifolium subterraneum]